MLYKRKATRYNKYQSKKENVRNSTMVEKTMDKIVALAKSRGFVYPGSEIYGGLANTWDYGNLGVELKNNVKKAWWKKFVQESPYNVGVDCAILMHTLFVDGNGNILILNDGVFTRCLIKKHFIVFLSILVQIRCV